MRAKMIRLFKNLQNFKDIFKKKKLQKFWGGQAPLGHQVAPPLLTISTRLIYLLRG